MRSAAGMPFARSSVLHAAPSQLGNHFRTTQGQEEYTLFPGSIQPLPPKFIISIIIYICDIRMILIKV